MVFKSVQGVRSRDRRDGEIAYLIGVIVSEKGESDRGTRRVSVTWRVWSDASMRFSAC